MDGDLAMVLGLICAFLSVPALISAFAGARPMRQPAILMVLAGLLITYASATTPGGYRAEDIPDVVLRVIARWTR